MSMISEKEADIIFMDPPYRAGYELDLLKALAGQPYVTENTLMIIEAELNRPFDFAEDIGLRIVKEKNYKTNKHIFIRRKTE